MNQLIAKQGRLLQQLIKEVSNRHKYFASKPLNWQYSRTGDRYTYKTNCLEDLVNTIESAMVTYSSQTNL